MLAKLINRTASATVAGRAFKIPVRNGVRCDPTEGWMVDVLRPLLKRRRGAFVDVGANLGQTLLKVKAIDPGRAYLGFEPNPSCVAYLMQLLGVNDFGGEIRLLPVGVAGATGMVRLDLIDGEVDSKASIIPNFRPGAAIAGSRFVPVFSGEDLPDLLPEEIAAVKIDVEGAELDVIQGLARHLSLSLPPILVEVLPVYDAARHPRRLERQRQLERITREMGYDWSRVLHPSDRFTELEPIDEVGVHGDLQRCDYLLEARA